MTRQQRLDAVLDVLAETGRVDVEQLVDRLGVSAATVRRDLDALAAARMLTRTRGGAVMPAGTYDVAGRYSRDEHAGQKEAIAAAASALVPAGAVVGLCGGTTSTAIAHALSVREDLMEPGPAPSLTVVTNAINIAAALVVRPQIRIMVTGGIVNPRSYELVGPYTDTLLQRVALDMAFIGVGGLDADVGPTVTDEGEAIVNALMARRARTSYIVADSSKIGRRAFATMDARFDGLITDAGIDDADRQRFAAAGTEVIVA